MSDVIKGLAEAQKLLEKARPNYQAGIVSPTSYDALKNALPDGDFERALSGIRLYPLVGFSEGEGLMFESDEDAKRFLHSVEAMVETGVAPADAVSLFRDLMKVPRKA